MLEDGLASQRSGSEAGSAFVQSMPDGYRRAFTAEQMREHAAISERRGERLSHIELWRAFSHGVFVFCVVADDRPGLLATICRVLLAHELEVLTAQIYCRRREGRATEAFDLFWVRLREDGRAGRELDAEAVELLARDLESALYVAARSTLPPPGAHSRFIRPSSPPRVYFNTNSLRRGEYVLVVEALDCPGLLLAISLALHRVGAQILGSDVRTEGALARDCFTLSNPNGTPLSSERLAAIRQAVVEAVRERLAESV